MQFEVLRQSLSQIFHMATTNNQSESGIPVESFIAQLISELPLPSPGACSPQLLHLSLLRCTRSGRMSVRFSAGDALQVTASLPLVRPLTSSMFPMHHLFSFFGVRCSKLALLASLLGCNHCRSIA